MFCLNCGSELSDSEQLCSKCGTPVQQPDETKVSEETDNKSDTSVLVQDEEETNAGGADKGENIPRLYQEPGSSPGEENLQERENADQVSVQAATQQPQYSQLVNQPQNWQAPVYPDSAPTSASAPAVPPNFPPFLKRKDYFKSPAAARIKGKLDVLSALTGMGLGVILVFAAVFLVMLFGSLYLTGVQPYIKFSDDILNNIDPQLTMIVSVAGLSVSFVFALLCILGMKTKLYGFYIPLMLPSLCLTVLTAVFAEYPLDQFASEYERTLKLELLIVLAAAAGLALILSVISLILSIIISRSYKKALRAHIWAAVSRVVQ